MHASGGLDDARLFALTKAGVWLGPDRIWSGQTGDKPQRRTGPIAWAIEAHDELLFRQGPCWRYLDAITNKTLWHSCTTNMENPHVQGVTPDGRWLIIDYHRWDALRNVSTGAITPLRNHIFYDAWEGHGMFLGVRSKGVGDRVWLYNCSAATGACRPFTSLKDGILTFTRTHSGFD
jgi:hypothetical protein